MSGAACALLLAAAATHECECAHAACMLARSAMLLRGGAQLSRWHCRDRSCGAEEEVAARVAGRLVGDPDPVQRVAENESNELRPAVKEMGCLWARCGHTAATMGRDDRGYWRWD